MSRSYINDGMSPQVIVHDGNRFVTYFLFAAFFSSVAIEPFTWSTNVIQGMVMTGGLEKNRKS